MLISRLWLIMKAYFLSFYYYLGLSTSSFNKIKSMHDLSDGNVVYDYTQQQKDLMQRIANAVKNVEKYAPWKVECYNLALVARKLLTTYNIPSILKIGFRKRNTEIQGHAWVMCNYIFISGYVRDIGTYNTLKPVK